MSRFTRTAYVERGTETNAQICKEIANLAGLEKLDSHNLPLVARGSKSHRKLKITVTVETVKD